MPRSHTRPIPKSHLGLTNRERSGIAIRLLPLEAQDRFRLAVAARPGFTQATYLVALLDIVDDLRESSKKGVTIDPLEVLKRHGLELVER